MNPAWSSYYYKPKIDVEGHASSDAELREVIEPRLLGGCGLWLSAPFCSFAARDLCRIKIRK
jgi:hypothetical protein